MSTDFFAPITAEEKSVVFQTHSDL